MKSMQNTMLAFPEMEICKIRKQTCLISDSTKNISERKCFNFKNYEWHSEFRPKLCCRSDGIWRVQKRGGPVCFYHVNLEGYHLMAFLLADGGKLIVVNHWAIPNEAKFNETNHFSCFCSHGLMLYLLLMSSEIWCCIPILVFSKIKCFQTSMTTVNTKMLMF